MDAALKARWVEALRSGKYKQGRQALLIDDGSRCCLGVLCAVMGVDDEELLRNGFRWPLQLRGIIPEKHSMDLTSMNDGGRLFNIVDEGTCSPASFAEIADYIERTL